MFVWPLLLVLVVLRTRWSGGLSHEHEDIMDMVSVWSMVGDVRRPELWRHVGVGAAPAPGVDADGQMEYVEDDIDLPGLYGGGGDASSLFVEIPRTQCEGRYDAVVAAFRDHVIRMPDENVLLVPMEGQVPRALADMASTWSWE